MGKCILSALVLVSCAAPEALAQDLVLARGGKAEGAIVLPDSPTPAEKYAAQELAAYLKKISGAEFAVEAAGGARAAVRLQHDPALASEECRLKADAAAKALVISGGRPRGVLYGVYALLEDHLGCRWFTRDAERVPRRETAAVPAALDVRVKPRLEYREPWERNG